MFATRGYRRRPSRVTPLTHEGISHGWAKPSQQTNKQLTHTYYILSPSNGLTLYDKVNRPEVIRVDLKQMSKRDHEKPSRLPSGDQEMLRGKP